MSDRTVERQQMIVVVGNMNPAIHHPGWYTAVGIMTETELGAAVKNPLTCSGDVAQFHFGEVEVLCIQDRWQVVAPASSGQRILDLSAQTFKRLYDTPIQAYGINNNFQVESGLPNVAARLGELAVALPLGLQPFGAPATATFVVRHPSPTCVFQTTIGASPKGPQFISIAHNAHYQAPTKSQFDLDVLLGEAWPAAAAHADAIVAAVSAALG